MINTPNYNLNKFQDNDKFNKDYINENFDKIDDAISDLQDTFNNSASDGALTTKEVVEARGGKETLKEKIDEIDTIQQSHSSSLEEITQDIDTKEYNIINEKRINGETNDNGRLQRALNYCIQNKFILRIPLNVDLYLSHVGNKTLEFTNTLKGYSIYIENKEVNIICDGNIYQDLTVRFNAFWFKNCKVNFKGGNFIGVNGTTKDLYNGNSIILENCYDSYVKNTKSIDNNGGTLFFKSVNCIMKNNFFNNTSNDMTKCGSAFGLYRGSYSSIENCTTYGSTGDGDIVLFGSGNFNKVIECKAFNSQKDLTITQVTAQGICVDSGQNNCDVYNNYCYGYYYGIDVKTNIEHCNVYNNVVERCKIGITSRRGEGSAPNVSCSIYDNTIINCGNGSTNLVSGYDAYAIWVQDTYVFNIHNNIIKNNTTYSKSYPHILVNFEVSNTSAYVKESTISNNSFITECGLASNVTSSNSPVILGGNTLKNMDLIIKDNVFTTSFGTKTSSSHIKATGFRTLEVKNNNFGRIDYHSIEIDGTPRLKIKNNEFDSNIGVLRIVNNPVTVFEFNNNTIQGNLSSTSLLVGAVTQAFVRNNFYRHAGQNLNFFTYFNSNTTYYADNNILNTFNVGADFYNTDCATPIKSNNNRF